MPDQSVAEGELPPMGLEITERSMSNPGATIHGASRIVDDATPFVASDNWRVSWLPGRVLTRNQAITAMTLAAYVEQMVREGAAHDHPMWPHVDGWAAELDLTGSHAMSLVTERATEVHDRYVAELVEAGKILRRIRMAAAHWVGRIVGRGELA